MEFHNPLVLADLNLHIVGELMDERARALHVSQRTVLQQASRPEPEPDTRGAARRAQDFEGIVLTDVPGAYPAPLLEKLARLHFRCIPVYSEGTFLKSEIPNF